MKAKTQYIKIKSENEVANAAKIEISVELAFDEPGRILRTDNESIMLGIEDVVAKNVEFCRSKPVDPDRSNMKILLCKSHSDEIVGIAGKIEEEGAEDGR